FRTYATDCLVCLFFFSSRRRHTRSKRDWSSDVCSSDLVLGKDIQLADFGDERLCHFHLADDLSKATISDIDVLVFDLLELQPARSEERRVGKGRRARWRRDAPQRREKESVR